MLPRDFYDKYGPVRKKLVEVTNTATPLVDFSRDRYLLWFIGGNTSVFVRPVGIEGVGTDGFQIFQSNDLLLTHALHGALVSEAFEGIVTFANFNLIVIEAFMVDVKNEHNGLVHGLDANSLDRLIAEEVKRVKRRKELANRLQTPCY